MAIVSMFMVKGTKSVRTVRDIKKAYEEIADDQYNIEKRGEAKSLSERLDDMEANLSGTDEPKTKKISKAQAKAIDADDFFNMKIEEKKTESIIGSAGLRKCPGCGWALSSTATKCPRCGRIIE
jgi:hypothetical protein